MKNRNHLLREIQELEFAALDLNLYLDTHPTCEKALMDYNIISKELNKKKKLYEMNYGPFSNFGEAPSQCPWEWINSPWPWESQY